MPLVTAYSTVHQLCHFINTHYRQVDPDTLKMTPRCLLVGHTAPVLCISKASKIQDNNYIVSSSEAGEMCTWDLVDGKCREAIKLPQVHTNMQVSLLSYLINSRLHQIYLSVFAGYIVRNFLLFISLFILHQECFIYRIK